MHLQKETQAGMYDLFMHVGDFAYDMHSVKGYFFSKSVLVGQVILLLKNLFQEGGRVGDEFMRQIEAIAAYVPYMTVAGNHEHK